MQEIKKVDVRDPYFTVLNGILYRVRVGPRIGRFGVHRPQLSEFPIIYTVVH